MHLDCTNEAAFVGEPDTAWEEQGTGPLPFPEGVCPFFPQGGKERVFLFKGTGRSPEYPFEVSEGAGREKISVNQFYGIT